VPSVATETIAAKVFAAEIFAIACPLLRASRAFQRHPNELPDPWIAAGCFILVYAPRHRVRRAASLHPKKRHCTP
jgi:hypothetical protein